MESSPDEPAQVLLGVCFNPPVMAEIASGKRVCMLPGEETRRADWLLVMGRDASIGCCMVDARSGEAERGSVGGRRVLLLS